MPRLAVAVAAAACSGTAAPASPPPGRAMLAPGRAHVVEGFLAPQEVLRLRTLLQEMRASGALMHGSLLGGSMQQCTLRAGTHPSAQGQLCPEEPNAIESPLLSVPERVRKHANQHLWLNSTLIGNYAYQGAVYPDMAVLRHYPNATQLATVGREEDEGVQNQASLHLDTDFDARCLSAVLFLNDVTDAGHLRLHGCRAAEESRCISIQGERLVQAMQEQYIVDEGNMRLTDKVLPVAGRLAYFLSETVHSVGPFSGERDVMLVWLSCKDLRASDVFRRRNHKALDTILFNPWAQEGRFLEVVRANLRSGNLVIITQAMPAQEAQWLHDELLQQDLRHWSTQAYNKAGRQFIRRILTCVGYGLDCPLFLGYFHRFLEAGMEFWSGLAKTALKSWTGRGARSTVATWFRKGDFMSPHTDLEDNCALSFVLGLTKDWMPEWGGSFWWLREAGAKEYTPEFNTLYLFRPTVSSFHTVSPVTSDHGRRMVISGCFTTG